MIQIPSEPIFNNEGQILMLGNRVQFSEKSVDIISFLLNNDKFHNLNKKFSYLCFCDLFNMCSPIIDPGYLGWL